MSWRHRPLLPLLPLLGLPGRATESRAAYTGPPTLRRTKAGLGCGGGGEMAAAAAAWAALSCFVSPPPSPGRHRRYNIPVYWSVLCVPSITEYKALQIQAWPLLISGHHRLDMVTLTSTYLYPGPVQHSVQCPLCPATGQN